jgi:hypothetical protein
MDSDFNRQPPEIELMSESSAYIDKYEKDEDEVPTTEDLWALVVEDNNTEASDDDCLFIDDNYAGMWGSPLQVNEDQ